MALSIDYKLASGHSNMQGKTLSVVKGEKMCLSRFWKP